MFLFRDHVLDGNKEIRASLLTVYGIGWRKAQLATTKAGLSYPFYFNTINGYNFGLVTTILKLLIISDVRIKRRVEFDVAKLVGIGNVKGLRHKLSLPVRGQRTRTNASTQRSKRIRRFVFAKMNEKVLKRK